MVLLLIAASNILRHFIAVTNIPNELVTWVLGHKVPIVVVYGCVYPSVISLLVVVVVIFCSPAECVIFAEHADEV